MSTGSKIEKSSIYETYFPIPLSKYIVIQCESKYESKDFNYWQDVLDIIVPILYKENIQVVQVGTIKEQPYKRVVDLRGQTSMNQLAYIIKNSICHIGPDSFGIHLASNYNVPLVGLYSIIQANVAGPYFGDKNKQILFEGYKNIGNGKPSYSPQEFPKSINTIKPEEIANAVFKLLNIDFNVPFKTVYTGKRYGNTIIRELIPNLPIVLNNPEAPVEIRMDLHFDEQILAHHLSYLKKAIIVTDKPISTKILKHFKPNIMVLVYKITKNDNPDFVKEVTGLGISNLLMSGLAESELKDKKFSYYEIGNINPIPIPDSKDVERLKQLDNLYYKSSKIITSKDKLFASQAAIENDNYISQDNEYQKIIDNELFWKDLDFYTIVQKSN